MKKWDIIIIVSILVLGIAGYIIIAINKTDASIANVYVNGELYGSYELSEDAVIEIDSDDGAMNTILIEKGYVSMRDANCPNKDCVMMGAISKNNESLCCAPNKVLVVVKSKDKSEFDAITL